MSDLHSVRSVVLAEAQRSSSPPWSRGLFQLLGVYLAVLGGALAVGVYAFHAEVRPVASSLLPLGLALMVGSVAALVPRAAGRWTVAGLLMLAVAAVAHLSTLRHDTGRPFFADADCAVAELAVAAVPAAVMVMVLRGFAYRRERALMGGAAAAVVGLATLDLTCPAGGLEHVLAFHLAPALAVVVFAGLWRRRASSRSFVP